MATHATGVTNLRPRIDRQAEAARLAEVLNASIIDRHNLAHRGDIYVCGDPICQSFAALMTAVA